MVPIDGARATRPPTVFVVENDERARRTLGRMISSSGFPVETFPGPPVFLGALAEEPPGCVVANLLMSEMSGLEFQRHLADGGHLLPFVLVSQFADVKSAVEVMKAGAVDFCLEPFPIQRLLDAIREAFRRNAALRARRARRVSALARLAPLTAREQEVLSLLVRGQANKVIAARLGISDNTVENHRAGIMRKTGVDHIAELVRLVLDAEAEPEVLSWPG